MYPVSSSHGFQMNLYKCPFESSTRHLTLPQTKFSVLTQQQFQPSRYSSQTLGGTFYFSHIRSFNKFCLLHLKSLLMISTNFNLVQVKITCLVYSNSLVSISNLAPLKSILPTRSSECFKKKKKPISWHCSPNGSLSQHRSYLSTSHYSAPTTTLLFLEGSKSSLRQKIFAHLVTTKPHLGMASQQGF